MIFDNKIEVEIHLRGESVPQVRLGLIVLRTARLEHCLAFYRIIGLEFVEEQHGKGPIHYAASLGNTVSY
jgi:catechol-2,3-dioxygenase